MDVCEVSNCELDESTERVVPPTLDSTKKSRFLSTGKLDEFPVASIAFPHNNLKLHKSLNS